MISFTQYINEELKAAKVLTHLEHPEDLMLDHGKEGLEHATTALKEVHDKLRGGFNNTRVTEKYDGSPSIVFGHDPKSKKFFVATKSAFNKEPKINYTNEDIIKNHGHAPGLVPKLQAALEHLPKVAPKSGVYQGDLMHTPEDVTDHDGQYHFTPNTLMYSTDKKSDEGKAIKDSKLGVVVHSKYHGPSLDNMRVGFNPDLGNFAKHKDVHMISPEVEVGKHSGKNATAFEYHIGRAEKMAMDAHPEALDNVMAHKDTLKTFINKSVREKSTPTTAGYKKHLMDIGDKEMEKVSTPKAKQAKHDKMMANLRYVEDHAAHFDSALGIHHHIQKAKDALVDSMGSSSQYTHSINGKEAKPEGFVAIRNGHPIKLVDRASFSHANFMKIKK